VTGERPLFAISIAALLLEALAGFLLLAVSVWFISACAVAGQASVAVNFNYVAPATVIRLLAILRIGAGYGEKYLGHLLLLRRLARCRHRLLASVFRDGRGPEHARATATLQQAAEDWAAVYSAVVAPQLAGTLLFVGLSLFVALLLPTQAVPLLTLGAVLLALRVLLQRLSDRLIETRETQAGRLDRALESWLGSSSLWSLNSAWSDVSVLEAKAAGYAASRRRLDALVRRGEDLLLVAGLITATALLYTAADHPATPLTSVPILVVAALRDWLRPALAASVRGRDTRHRIRSMSSHYDVGDAPVTDTSDTQRPAAVTGLRLENFRWQREDRVGAPLTTDLEAPGLYLLEGSSGTGKTSLFEALSGELGYGGSARLGGVELNALDAGERRARLYLAEQFGHVFSDTLEHNLRLASPEATDADLVDALRWSGFIGAAETTELRQWLGEQGRLLSGGERKRLLLARAFLSRAPVWLVDEPFEGLDEALALSMARRLNEAARSHLIIVASHLTPPFLQPRGSIRCDAGTA